MLFEIKYLKLRKMILKQLCIFVVKYQLQCIFYKAVVERCIKPIHSKYY